VIDLVLGKKNKLHLGYCIVRNRGQSELSTDSSERHSVEDAFFNRGAWATVDKDRVGVSALKERLQELLADITRREFPKVKLQIDRQLMQCKENLDKLGPDRESAEQQRQYLQHMAVEAQKLADYAIDAYYARHKAFDEVPEFRLSTLIVAHNDKYAKDIETKGHTIDFRLPEKSEDGDAIESPGSDPTE
jgi:hypothetical protein